MSNINFLASVFFAVVLKLIQAQQFYDETSCSSHIISKGSRYLCNSPLKSCKTFVVYRPQPRFQTVSSIAELLGASQTEVLILNNLESASMVLGNRTDLLVPINCSCSGQYSEANISYIVSQNLTHSDIACGVFEGLVKTHTLLKLNPYPKNKLKIGNKLTVPVKCACSDNYTGVIYLVTYPLIRGVGTKKLGVKFNISPAEIWKANSFKLSFPTVYPHTTLLVPINRTPHIYPVPTSPTIGFMPITPTNITERRSISRKPLYITISISVAVLVLFVSLVVGFYFRLEWKKKKNELQVSSARSPQIPRLSPDLVKGMSMLKYSLFNYTLEELRIATDDFSEDTKIGNLVHRAMLDGSEVVIKRMSSEEADRVIDIYSKINHTNMVRLMGVCHGDGDCAESSYLVFEFATNGCLRDCLSDQSKVLQWRNRMQIAFDIAIGLHYIHHCTIPSYTHLNINDKTILVMEDWRAKMANLGTAHEVDSSKERRDSIDSKGWVAPEYFVHGLVSSKVDIFAFGVVLLVLVSGREAADGSISKDSLGFLGGGESEIDYVEKLRDFMDPCLKDDYPVGEALCLAILAKACLEDDPSHRPTMNDILKILARMV